MSGKNRFKINEDLAYRIGRATVETLGESVVVGFEGNIPILAAAIGEVYVLLALTLDIGLAGTEEMYAAVSKLNADAGIEVTASHNPIEYNGFKFVKSDAQPLSKKDFSNIRTLSEDKNFCNVEKVGLTVNKQKEAHNAYVQKLLSFVDTNKLKPLKIVINSGNGVAGPVIDSLNYALLAKGVKTDFVLINNTPDSSFPNGIPNPLLKITALLLRN